MRQETFRQAMGYLAAAYTTEISTERAAVYWDQLGGLRDEPFLAACKVAVGSGERFPPVARLRALYQDELRRLAMSATPRLARLGPADREKSRALIRSLRERMRP